jgi:hypothetical protein
MACDFAGRTQLRQMLTAPPAQQHNNVPVKTSTSIQTHLIVFRLIVWAIQCIAQTFGDWAIPWQAPAAPGGASPAAGPGCSRCAAAAAPQCWATPARSGSTPRSRRAQCTVPTRCEHATHGPPGGALQRTAPESALHCQSTQAHDHHSELTGQRFQAILSHHPNAVHGRCV